MKSHELIKQLLKTQGAKHLANALGVSPSLVYKWAETPEAGGSGAPNPLDRVVDLIDQTGDIQLLDWICAQANGSFVRDPEIQSYSGNKPMGEATHEIVQKFATLLSSIAAAAMDGKISNGETSEIRKQWQKVKSFTEYFVRCCEQRNFADNQAGRLRKAQTAPLAGLNATSTTKKGRPISGRPRLN